MVTDKEYEQFFELLGKVIRGDGGWRERLDSLIAQASDDDKTNLSELADWLDAAEI